MSIEKRRRQNCPDREHRADPNCTDHHVNGRPQDYDAVPVAANATGGGLGNCASTAGAIHYYERAAGSEA